MSYYQRDVPYGLQVQKQSAALSETCYMFDFEFTKDILCIAIIGGWTAMFLLRIVYRRLLVLWQYPTIFNCYN